MLIFSTLNASDANAINEIVSRFKPYSDFNFISLYSWSLHSQVKFCIYNDCLFLILPDYVTQEPSYTFICGSNYEQNLELFIAWLKSRSLPLDFVLLPEDVIKNLLPYLEKTYTYEILEDRDSFDYILDTRQLSLAEGKKYEDIRYKTSLFNRTWGDSIKDMSFDPRNHDHKLMAIKLASRWAERKKDNNHLYQDEIDAFNRFLNISAQRGDIIFKAFSHHDDLIALASYERISEDFSLGHFLKFDYNYKNLYYKLVRDICHDHVQIGVPFINIEQDLGIEGMRQAKTHLKPVDFFKKYSLTITS